MKKIFTVLSKANRPRTDHKLSRGFLTSLVTVSPFPGHHQNSPFAHHRHFSLRTADLLSSPNSHMERHPQGTCDAVKDEASEGFAKESCDYKSSRSLSDQIMPHLLNLYASRATPQDFKIYAPLATFEDPLMHADGVQQIKSAFYSLSKVFSESRIVDFSIEENTISPGKTQILIDNKQHYKFLGRDIDMTSLIKLYTEDGKIVRHEDWWDKKPLWDRETVKTPFLGRIMEATRRASMLATHALMRFGKDPST